MRLTQTQCLEMGTINGAKAMGIADKTGSLNPASAPTSFFCAQATST